tara:strand:- start:339 stop:512 length:174 start_codon:yes stop_codon:yes gene_type:complete
MKSVPDVASRLPSNWSDDAKNDFLKKLEEKRKKKHEETKKLLKRLEVEKGFNFSSKE